MLADRTARSVESCQVSVAQWVGLGHLSEGDGLSGGRLDAIEAARLLLERLDLGQATGNGLETTQALEDIAGISDGPAEGDGEATASLHRQKLEGQARIAQANAARMELKAAQEAGELLPRQEAQAVMAQLLQAEVTAWRQFLDDLADHAAGEHGLDAQALRQMFRGQFRAHRSARSDAQAKVAAALAERGEADETTGEEAAAEVAEG